ncbi:hypothetical protein DFH08DRAFT_469448 [Mycena albidolilacea]|uniref:Uncharacterized protein n=1 Tax=Mycena albidolilacea TaxID=1033008 RepID=A0AAD7AF11_9AGAR|nr:hypothetical protein DFH08DRAFT_469448 [Mycena albidolilacea]
MRVMARAAVSAITELQITTTVRSAPENDRHVLGQFCQLLAVGCRAKKGIRSGRGLHLITSGWNFAESQNALRSRRVPASRCGCNHQVVRQDWISTLLRFPECRSSSGPAGDGDGDGEAQSRGLEIARYLILVHTRCRQKLLIPARYFYGF